MTLAQAPQLVLSTWQRVAERLKAATTGGDVDQLAITPRLVLFMVHVECR